MPKRGSYYLFQGRVPQSFATIPTMRKRRNETRALGARWSKSHTKFGEVKWAEPVTHEARNTGTTEQHVIRVELK